MLMLAAESRLARMTKSCKELYVNTV